MSSRDIIHVDMDAFFAAIEQQRHPEYEGKPVIVGGHPRSRGVVSAASYEARKYGIHSSMPLRIAHKRCPIAIFLPVDMKKYREVSQQLMAILSRFTPLLEPAGLDEAYLDITDHKGEFQTAEQTAKAIKQTIKQELCSTASIGVGPNKLIAKIASDLNKPNGLTIIKPEEVHKTLAPLPVAKLWGVGPKTQERLEALGIITIGELSQTPLEQLQENFGKTYGQALHRLAHGIDDSPVAPPGEPKSTSAEVTYEKDTDDLKLIKSTLQDLVQTLTNGLIASNYKCCTISLKLRYSNFTTFTRNHTLEEPTNSPEFIFQTILWLLAKSLPLKRKIRLVGVRISNFTQQKESQLHLFEPFQIAE